MSTISLNIDSGVATAVLDYPPVNAIGQSFVDAMNQVLEQVESRQDVTVFRLRSACKVFCAGADLGLMRHAIATPQGADVMVGLIRQLQRVYRRLEELNAVTVAEIGGAALGGGLELALACDLRICAETARLGLPEAGLGLLPGAGGTQRLPRVCGEAVARRLILGAEVVDGREAVRLGLVQWAVPAEQLESSTRELVQRLARLPRKALVACKRCIVASGNGSVDGYELELTETRQLYGDDATRELLRAFLHKPVQAG
jgi:enoyl-CoA hydratase